MDDAVTVDYLGRVHTAMHEPHKTPPAPKSKYTTSQELARLIRTYQHMRQRMQAAKLARLQEIVEQIAAGVWSRWRHVASREDFVQECWVACLLKAFRRVDPARNTFSYITTVCVNVGNSMRLREVRGEIGEGGYRSEYISEQRYATYDPDPE